MVPPCSPIQHMLRKISAIFALAAATMLLPAPVRAETDYNDVGKVTAIMLRNLHFNKQPWDEKLSGRLLDEYLALLDFQKLYLTQEDVDVFRKKYGESLHMRLLDADWLAPAQEIFQTYLARVEARHAWTENYLRTHTPAFDSTGTVEISREKAAWPANQAEADKLWAARLDESLLREKLRADEAAAKAAAKPADATAKPAPKAEEDKPEEKILKRYKRVLENVRETNTEEVCDFFLSALTACYDPHTEYFSFSEEEQFQTSMRNSLTGIGALLQSDDDGTTQIKGIVEKGPADKGGQLHLDDRVIGVDRLNSGEMVDIVYMKINKVVELIRGEEGTEVRLKIIPADAPTTTREIVIKREKVELKDQLADGQIIRRQTSRRLHRCHSAGSMCRPSTPTWKTARPESPRTCAALLAAHDEGKHRRPRHRPARQWRRFARRGHQAHRIVHQVRPGGAGQGLRNKRIEARDSQGARAIVCRPDGRAHRQDQRLGQRDFRRRLAGLPPRPDRRRQIHLRQRHRADHRSRRPRHALLADKDRAGSLKVTIQNSTASPAARPSSRAWFPISSCHRASMPSRSARMP